MKPIPALYIAVFEMLLSIVPAKTRRENLPNDIQTLPLKTQSLYILVFCK